MTRARAAWERGLRGAGAPFVLVALLASACRREAPPVVGRFEEGGSGALTAGEVLAASDRYRGERLTVEGRVVDVCPTAGCWLEIESGGQRLHAELLGFTASWSWVGARCRVQGKLVERQGRWTLLARGVAFER